MDLDEAYQAGQAPAAGGDFGHEDWGGFDQPAPVAASANWGPLQRQRAYPQSAYQQVGQQSAPEENYGAMDLLLNGRRSVQVYGPGVWQNVPNSDYGTYRDLQARTAAMNQLRQQGQQNQNWQQAEGNAMAGQFQAPAVLPFTQANRFELQRLQNTLAQVEQRSGANLDTPEETAQQRQMIMPRIQELTQRQNQTQQQAQQQALSQQQAMAQHQAALLESIQQHNAAAQARTFQQQVSTFVNPETGQQAHFVRNPRTGAMTQVKWQDTQPQQRQPPQITPQQMSSTRQHIEQNVRQEYMNFRHGEFEAAQEPPPGRPPAPQPTRPAWLGAEPTGPWQSPEQREGAMRNAAEAAIRRETERRMDAHFGDVRRRAGVQPIGGVSQSGQPLSAPNAASPGGQGVQATPQQPPQTPPARQPGVILNGFLAASANAALLPAADRQRYQDDIDRGRALAMQAMNGGGFERLAPAQQDELNQIASRLQRMPQPQGGPSGDLRQRRRDAIRQRMDQERQRAGIWAAPRWLVPDPEPETADDWFEPGTANFRSGV